MLSIDSHCHIQQSEVETLVHVKTFKLAVMGTMPKDWSIVAQLTQKFEPRIIPCFGVHPWFAESLENESSKVPKVEKGSEKPEIWWLSLLKDYLNRFSNALVGEIGIDKYAVDPKTKKPYDFNAQRRALCLQFQLAATLRRSVSVHCVQAFGVLVDLFKEIKNDILLPNDSDKKMGLSFPPKIMLHSFSGSAETLNSLKALVSFSSKEMKAINNNLCDGAKRNPEFERSNLSSAPFSPPMLFVSISELVNMRSEKKLEKLLKTFSIDRILLESDCGSVSQVDEKLEIIAVKCSSLLNVTVQTFIEQVSKNSELFFMTNSN